MELSSEIGLPTIDKIGLFSTDFFLKKSNKFTKTTESVGGKITKQKLFFNSSSCSITVRKGYKSDQVMQLLFNPNKASIESILADCKFVGIDFPLLASSLNRVDVERHQKLDYNLKAYHSILNQCVSGNHVKGIINSTFRIGSKSNSIQFYDKSVESNLNVPGIVRVESSLRKPEYINRNGITTLESLLNADTTKLMQLYNQPKSLYLKHLDDFTASSHTDIGSLLSEFERTYKSESKFLTKFLSLYGLHSIGVDNMRTIIESSNIPSQQKSNARKFIARLSASGKADFLGSSMIKEILSYFSLAV